jgi:mycothione reductase
MTEHDYGLIAIGTGSAMMVVEGFLQRYPAARVAVIDKDEPGGICLTRGCIPSKILLYAAEVAGTVRRASEFGVDAPITGIRFGDVMGRMRRLITADIDSIRRGLSHSPRIDYFPSVAEFVAPGTLRVAGREIRGERFVLGTGSAPTIPPIPGLAEAGYLTSDTVLALRELPESLAVIGGGYVAAEFGHFFAAMGSKVTLVGRNPRFLPAEEPEVSEVARRALGRELTLLTNRAVTRVRRVGPDRRQVELADRATGATHAIDAEAILVATGRGPTGPGLHPERGGIATDEHGWIRTDEFLRTSQENVYALGDATGRFPFKHKANYDAKVVYQNLVLGRSERVDYHAVPHAVFTDPEVASVGLGEKEALALVGEPQLLVGYYPFEQTAKGEAMALREYFVKVLLERGTARLLGAHIVGPHASILLQELVNLMYTPERSVRPIVDGMHIHPALSEVVERACLQPMSVAQYHARAPPSAAT